MHLNYKISNFVSILETSLYGKFDEDVIIDRVFTDTRKIFVTQNAVFFSLKGTFRTGNEFLNAAYQKGLRCFVVNELPDLKSFDDAVFLKVDNVLKALQMLASHHRSLFHYPVIAITGSHGKTSVKEYLYHFLKRNFDVVRSPKSYNSQLGVALSLLELSENHNLALIEAGISEINEMEFLEKMIQPTYVVFTGFGSAHRHNFIDWQQHLMEKIKLFKNAQKVFLPTGLSEEELNIIKSSNVAMISPEKQEWSNNLNKVEKENLNLTYQVCQEFDVDLPSFVNDLDTLPSLAMRMELFEGFNNNLVINDTYNLDLEALSESLEYQLSISKGKERIVILGLNEDMQRMKHEVCELVERYKPSKTLFYGIDDINLSEIQNTVILLKGSRSLQMQKLAANFRLKKHSTFIEINLNSLRHNLVYFKSLLKPETNILAMVKASAYGNGIEKIVDFLKFSGIQYFGVAYADEGMEIRQFDPNSNILVMNADEDDFSDCIKYNLEPAIFSFKQLNSFIEELIIQEKSAFPIHIKLDSGMHRLGFDGEDVKELAATILAQPEVMVASVYSHLADADNKEDRTFSEQQFEIFEQFCQILEKNIGYGFKKHILNSEGTNHYPEKQFDMVRLGIGMYGISSFKNKYLEPVISWYSKISQIKSIKKGDCVGYSCAFTAESDMTIAIIPVGYGDGFKRNLGNGKGGVFINSQFCSTVGRVCMDMIMVNLGDLKVSEGTKAEIIGSQQTIDDFATKAETIPYEILTGFSKRVHRVYIS